MRLLSQQEKDAWLAELRDPNNKQIVGKNFESGIIAFGRDAIVAADCMCAVGCLIKAHHKLIPHETHPTTIVDHINTKEKPHCWRDIVDLNDKEKLTFLEIADWVEKNVLVEA